MKIKLNFGQKQEPVSTGIKVRTQLMAGKCTQAQMDKCRAEFVENLTTYRKQNALPIFMECVDDCGGQGWPIV